MVPIRCPENIQIENPSLFRRTYSTENMGKIPYVIKSKELSGLTGNHGARLLAAHELPVNGFHRRI